MAESLIRIPYVDDITFSTIYNEFEFAYQQSGYRYFCESTFVNRLPVYFRSKQLFEFNDIERPDDVARQVL